MGKKTTIRQASDPLVIELPEQSYQPSVAKHREEFDMPGASAERVRQAFFSPVVVNRKPAK
jgi:hypothetical protein